MLAGHLAVALGSRRAGLLLGALVMSHWVLDTDARDRAGRWSLAAPLALIGFVWVTQPWSPPPPSSTAVAWDALILWLVPPWAAWVDHHRKATSRGPRPVPSGSA